MNNPGLTIGFASDLVPLVRDGSKTFTYRLGRKFETVEVGDIVSVRDSSSGEILGQVEIIEKSSALFKDLPLNRPGHEVYHSKEEQRKTFEKYYSKKINGSEKVLILGFKLVKVL